MNKKRNGATEEEPWPDLEVVSESIETLFHKKVKIGNKYYLSQVAELILQEDDFLI